MKHARDDIPTFSEKIPSRIDEAELLCLKIRGLLQPDNLRQVCFPVELLTRECLNNAVLHGNQGNPNKSVELRLWVKKSWIRLQVSDEGKGFDWQKTRQLSDASISSGRGLQLYATYARHVRFNDCGNQITLWISRKTK